MKADKLAMNCGVAVFHNFGGTGINAEVSIGPNTPKDANDWLDKNEKFQKECLGVGMVVVTLNDEQYEKFGDMFAERGYVVASAAFNPKHSSINRLLVKVLIEVPKGFEQDFDDYGLRDDSVGYNGFNKSLTEAQLKQIATDAGQGFTYVNG